MEVELRAPTRDDAKAAALCQLACWAEAYADIVDPVRLAALVGGVEERVARWREIVVGPTRVRLADDSGAVVGFASVGPARDRRPGDPELEVYAIYTRAAYWSTGLGHRLLEATLGPDPASLWVFRDNPRARRFYAAHGFVPTGEEQEQPVFGEKEVRFVRTVSPV